MDQRTDKITKKPRIIHNDHGSVAKNVRLNTKYIYTHIHTEYNTPTYTKKHKKTRIWINHKETLFPPANDIPYITL